MKNIIEYFKENKILFTFKYYGIQDFASGWDIKTIIENQSIFLNLYDIFTLNKIECKEEYYIYLLTVKFTKLEELIPGILDDENKNVIQKLVDKAKEISNKIVNGDIIRFINNNYKELFDEELYVYDIPFLTLDLIIKFISGINADVIEFLISNHKYMIINRFDEFENWFEDNPNYFEMLFPNDNIKEDDYYHLGTVLDIWKHIYNKKKTNLKNYIGNNTQSMYLNIEKLVTDANSKSIIRIDSIVRKFNSFLIDVKSPLANKFIKYIKIAKNLMEEHLKTNGFVYEYEIPVKEMVDLWKNESVWENRLLSSTHVCKIENKTKSYNSCLSSIKREKGSLMDLVSTNIPTNDSFTFSYQQDLRIKVNIHTALFCEIISNVELLNDYFNLLLSAVTFISKKVDEDSLINDCEFLLDNINLLSSNLEADKSIVSAFCYGSSIYICSFAEKLLRMFYKYLLKDVCYVPVNKATLGQLLTENNKQIIDIFGKEHVLNLAFYLTRVQPNDVGVNIRNSLAHWDGLNKDDMTISLVARLLYLFTDILNTVFWYFIKKEQDSIKGD